MARPGDTLRLGKDTLTFLTTAAETGGAYVEVAVEYAPAVIKPPQHYHPRQTEHMRLESGRLSLQLDGTLHEYEPGADFHIPRAPSTPCGTPDPTPPASSGAPPPPTRPKPSSRPCGD